MKTVVLCVVSGCILLMQVGCQTTAGWEEQQRRDARITSDIESLRVGLQRLEHRVADLTREQETLGQDLQSARYEMQQNTSQTDVALTALSARLDEQARSQVTLRQELTQDLSSRMASILQSQAQAQAQRVQSGTRAEAGYEHEVRQGETLSEIARAYGVSARDIMQANRLNNADVLRIGQKLFIPDRSR
jgi:LysM repeat protein